jgi:hypothetical protein
MDWTLLIIGTLTALLGVFSIHLVWREQKRTSQNTLNPIDRLGAQGAKPPGKSVPDEIHAILKKDGGDNRKCTYEHKGSNGSRWRTKWC